MKKIIFSLIFLSPTVLICFAQENLTYLTFRYNHSCYDDDFQVVSLENSILTVRVKPASQISYCDAYYITTAENASFTWYSMPDTTSMKTQDHMYDTSGVYAHWHKQEDGDIAATAGLSFGKDQILKIHFSHKMNVITFTAKLTKKQMDFLGGKVELPDASKLNFYEPGGFVLKKSLD